MTELQAVEDLLGCSDHEYNCTDGEMSAQWFRVIELKEKITPDVIAVARENIINRFRKKNPSGVIPMLELVIDKHIEYLNDQLAL